MLKAESQMSSVTGNRGRRRVYWCAAFCLAALCAPLIRADESITGRKNAKSKAAAAEDAPRSYVIRAKTIYPVTTDQPGPIEGGVMIVRDGKIAAVGTAGLAIPGDLPIIDLPDGVICPAFVDAGGTVTGWHNGPETASGAYRAVDSFDSYGDYRDWLARGTGTSHVSSGGHRLISGRGAVAKLGGDPQRRVLREEADLSVNLGVFRPPPLMKPPFYASSDTPIEPAQYQRPETRLGEALELETELAAAKALIKGERPAGSKFSVHTRGLADALRAHALLRVQARQAVDIAAAINWLKRENVPAYLVALSEGEENADAIVKSGLPVVVRVEVPYRSTADGLGPDPEAFVPRVDVAARLARAGAKVALTGPEGDWGNDPQIIAALAVRGGLSPEAALAGITRVPAEILGVAERVGSLAPGRDADFVVLSGRPLEISSRVQRTYIDGRPAFEVPESHTVVVKAGTIWVGNGTILRDASVLIEDGKVRAIGQRVPVPMGAKVIDAGSNGFVAPGFIDAHSHLGLEGDRNVAQPDLSIASLLSVAGPEFQRVARAGITTVLVSAYNGAPNGARIAAAKTWGAGGELIVRDVAAVLFSLRGADPLLGVNPLKAALEAAKKYEEQWKKYNEELEKWKKDKEAGKTVEKPKEETAETVTASGPDPLTGVWEVTTSRRVPGFPNR